jgi:hypothetical protein
MRSINKRTSIARRWLLSNLNDLKSNLFPREVINELKIYKDEDIYDLSCEMIEYRFLYMFEEYKGISCQENDEIYIHEYEYDNFVETYYNTKFNDFDNRNAMIDFLIDKLCIILKVIIMSETGDVVLQNSFGIWDVVERKADLLCVKSKRPSGKTIIKNKTKVPVFDWRIQVPEKSIYQNIKADLIQKRFCKAQKTLVDFEKIISMLNF